jgi:hypothetical protein
MAQCSILKHINYMEEIFQTTIQKDTYMRNNRQSISYVKKISSNE